MATPVQPALVELNQQHVALHAAPGLDNDIADDIAILKANGVGAVITLLTSVELEQFGLTTLGKDIEAAGMQWHHLPVKDKSLPDSAFQQSWPASLSQLKTVLTEGKAVSVHCRGGTGRTGLIAAKLLLDQGCEFQAVVEAVRAARPGALSADAQLDYLKG